MPRGATTVGLVGCGRWGRNVLRDLLALGCDVHVADPDNAARAAAAAAGAASVVADAGSLPHCDGHVVASPASTHAAAVRGLLAGGRPVFVEKPFTTDSASADELAASGGGRVFVMDKWRYHPAVGALRDLAASGLLGEVAAVRTRRWSTTRSQADVGAEWTLAPHDLSVLDELMGPVSSVRTAEVVAPDGLVERLTVTFDGGAPGSIDVWDSAPSFERSITLVGRFGSAVWSSDDEHAVVVDVAGAAPDRRAVHDAGPPLLLELTEFVGHLAGGPPPRSAAADGARHVALIEAAVRRARSGDPSGAPPEVLR